MDKEKHTTVNFCGPEKAAKYLNNPFFRAIDEMDNETFEVGSRARNTMHFLFYLYLLTHS